MARHNSHFPFVNHFGNIFHLWCSWLHLIQKSNMVSVLMKGMYNLSSHHKKFWNSSDSRTAKSLQGFLKILSDQAWISGIEKSLLASLGMSQWISGSMFELLKSVPVGVSPTNKKTLKIYSFKHFSNLNDLLTLNNKVLSEELLLPSVHMN